MTKIRSNGFIRCLGWVWLRLPYDWLIIMPCKSWFFPGLMASYMGKPIYKSSSSTLKWTTGLFKMKQRRGLPFLSLNAPRWSMMNCGWISVVYAIDIKKADDAVSLTEIRCYSVPFCNDGIFIAFFICLLASCLFDFRINFEKSCPFPSMSIFYWVINFTN